MNELNLKNWFIKYRYQLLMTFGVPMVIYIGIIAIINGIKYTNNLIYDKYRKNKKVKDNLVENDYRKD